MKKFLKNRVLPFVCAFSILVSVCVIPAAAEWDVDFDDRDDESVEQLEAQLMVPADLDLMVKFFGLEASATVGDVFWHIVNKMVLVPDSTGEVGYDQLDAICKHYNFCFNRPLSETFFGQIVSGTQEVVNDLVSVAFFGEIVSFEIRPWGTSGYYRIYIPELDAYVVSSNGRYAYTPIGGGDTAGGNQWLEFGPVKRMVDANSAKVNKSVSNLDWLRDKLSDSEVDCRVVTVSDKYRMICTEDGEMVYCDPNGYPFVNDYDPNEWASNQDRPDTSVKDENGNEIEGLPEDNETGLDLENMLIYLPNGSIGMIDTLIYDESTKSYHIDSHDTYNTEINYYYEWNYYINYTSITYIGQTEEYNKYYEVYYELPDGRDSADLTKEDVEQLNLSVDVIPYERHADDTSLRSLYHFDGDTKDSSYWNYYTDFTWNTGASLTYMDAGVFDGALYLDENEHDFTLKLPGSIGYGDFTLQFRYYQSHTLTPQTDSYISFDPYKTYYPLKLDGANLKLDSNTVGADDITAATISTGQWNEIAIVRHDGVGYWYLNGVRVGMDSTLGGVPLGEAVTFHFGNEQETFKYLDELRILDYALVEDGEAYEPTAVPYDTNLTLVLPASEVAVADEYWEITSSKKNLLSANIAEWSAGSVPQDLVELEPYVDDYQGILYEVDDYLFPKWGYRPSYNEFYSGMNSTAIYTHATNEVTGLPYLAYGSDEGDLYLRNGIFSALSATISGGSHKSSLYEVGKTYTLSMVAADGSIGSVSYTIGAEITGAFDSSDYTIMFNGYRMGFVDDYYGNPVIVVQPAEGGTLNYFVYLELVEGDFTDLEAEKVSSVVGMEKDALNTPTLAVRTDLEITSYQIGGVRPSLPEKGQVWALVENERIISIQIYNGQAWEAVDGRIWTGSRWIPASSYNIITLQDMYDIVDATPDYEYIYSEAGFWAWFQKAWNAFMVKVDQIIILLSGGSICQHTYISEITREASCAVPGALLYTCTLCEHTYEEEIPMIAHTWEVTGQGNSGIYKPNYADSLEDCVDTSLEYVLPDGYVYRYVSSMGTNLYDPGAVTLGYNLLSYSPFVNASSTFFITDYIPVNIASADPAYLRLIGSFTNIADKTSNGLPAISSVSYFDSNYNFIANQGVREDLPRANTNYFVGGFDFPIGYISSYQKWVKCDKYDQIAYVRFAVQFKYATTSTDTSVITSISPVSSSWVNTGVHVDTLLEGYNKLTCSVCGATAKDFGQGPTEIVEPESPEGEDEDFSVLELFGVLNDGVWKIVTGVVSTAFDGFTSFVSSVGDAGSFFAPYRKGSENSIFLIPLEEGATVWD